jgi:copper homeostasis protein
MQSAACALHSQCKGHAAIRGLVQAAAGRIAILAGGGVRAGNAATLVRETGVRELHSSARR